MHGQFVPLAQTTMIALSRLALLPVVHGLAERLMDRRGANNCSTNLNIELC